jgi:hypothetical protein
MEAVCSSETLAGYLQVHTALQPTHVSPEDEGNMFHRNTGIWHSPHGVTTQRTNIDMFAALRNSKPIGIFCPCLYTLVIFDHNVCVTARVMTLLSKKFRVVAEQGYSPSQPQPGINSFISRFNYVEVLQLVSMNLIITHTTL